MHDSSAVAVIKGLGDLAEDVEFGLLGQAIKVLIQIVHETHLKELSDNTNVLIAHKKLLEFEDF